MKNFFNKASKNSQSGFAAIIVTLIVVALVMLLVIGFVSIVNRESRSSIDQQLSTQAFYAAETGINDAAQLLAEAEITEDIDDCSAFEASDLATTKILGDDDSVEYTCVLIDRTPSSLAKSSVGTDGPTSLLLRGVDESGDVLSASGGYISTITINWHMEGVDPAASPSFRSDDNTFPESWGHDAPVLRTALTSLSSFDRQSLIENTFTTFLRPRDGSGVGTSVTALFGSGNVAQQGSIQNIVCNPATLADTDRSRYCSAEINVASVEQAEFNLVLRSTYTNADVIITGLDDGGNPVFFADQQAVIDSTGRANDVFRRIQARVPLRNESKVPGFGVETSKLGGICKTFTLAPGVVSDSC